METAENLIAYAKENGRICPMPMRWNEFYTRITEDQSSKPPQPLILAAWHETPALMKMIRLQEHIEFAAQTGRLDLAAEFLRSLPEDQWHHL